MATILLLVIFLAGLAIDLFKVRPLGMTSLKGLLLLFFFRAILKYFHLGVSKGKLSIKR